MNTNMFYIYFCFFYRGHWICTDLVRPSSHRNVPVSPINYELIFVCDTNIYILKKYI